MRHVVSFSTGLSSALVAERVLSRYGAANVDIVAMDTLAEDSDNWRFAAECEARWGQQIIVLRDGRTPRQVAEQKQIIPNQKIAPCTIELKIKPFRNWLKENFSDGEPVTIHIGYDIFEAHRCAATKNSYESYGWQVDFPLLWKPIEHRPYTQVARDDWGIEPPRTYGMGFAHANCLGDTFCFKAGQADVARVLLNLPENYKRGEAWEAKMRDHPVRKNYAILRDRKGGDVSPLPLSEFRKRIEAKSSAQPSLFDSLDQMSPACVFCGAGDMIGADDDTN